jgi:hypothetical protein
VKDGFGRVPEEVVEVRFANVGGAEEIVLLEGFNGFDSERCENE